MEIKIKIEGLDQFTESIALLASAMAYRNGMLNTAKDAIDIVDKTVVEEKKVVETPKKEAIKETKEKIATESREMHKEVESKFTREDVRAAFVEKNSPSTRNKLKAILDKFETPNITELEEKYFEDAMKELEAI